MFGAVDFRKKRKGGEVKGASGGKKVKKEETKEEKQLKVSSPAYKSTCQANSGSTSSSGVEGKGVS